MKIFRIILCIIYIKLPLYRILYHYLTIIITTIYVCSAIKRWVIKYCRSIYIEYLDIFSTENLYRASWYFFSLSICIEYQDPFFMYKVIPWPLIRKWLQYPMLWMSSSLLLNRIQSTVDVAVATNAGIPISYIYFELERGHLSSRSPHLVLFM